MRSDFMEIVTERYVDEIIVTIVKVTGRLDSSTCGSLLKVVQQLVEDGERYIIFDLQHVTFLGSAGLIALHQAAKLLNGEPMLHHDFGWGSFHALEYDLSRGESIGLKVLRPSAAAIETMVTSGFAALVEPYANLDSVIASFHDEAFTPADGDGMYAAPLYVQ
jgi:anti-anti-sigma factor